MESSNRFDERDWTPGVSSEGSSEREAFLMHYVPLVRTLVGRIAVRLPKGLDLPDLIGEGVIGLIDAVNRFDPSRGIPFGVYARRRIRGAVLDRLRAADPLPRSARDRDDRIRALSAEPGRPRTVEEIAEALGLEVKQVDRARRSPVIVPLESLRPPGGDPDSAQGSTRVEMPPAKEDQSPLASLLGRERENLVRAAVAGLPERERLLMNLYYVEELTMKEIGEVMGITESRVCQIHRRALARVRKKLRIFAAEACRPAGAGARL